MILPSKVKLPPFSMGSILVIHGNLDFIPLMSSELKQGKTDTDFWHFGWGKVSWHFKYFHIALQVIVKLFNEIIIVRWFHTFFLLNLEVFALDISYLLNN